MQSHPRALSGASCELLGVAAQPPLGQLSRPKAVGDQLIQIVLEGLAVHAEAAPLLRVREAIAVAALGGWRRAPMTSTTADTVTEHLNSVPFSGCRLKGLALLSRDV